MTDMEALKITPINKVTPQQALRRYRNSPLSLILRLLVTLSAILTVAVLLFLIAYIVVMGVPNLKPSLFSLEYNSENASLFPALILSLIHISFKMLLQLRISMMMTVGIMAGIVMCSNCLKRLAPSMEAASYLSLIHIYVPAVQHHIGALAQDIPDRFGMILKGAVRRYILPKIAAVADSKNHAPLLFAKLRHFRIVNALYTVDQVVGRHQPHRAAFPDGRLKGLQIIFMLEPRRHIGIGGLPLVLIIVGIEMLQQRRGF